VKVSLHDPPEAMRLGAVVTGSLEIKGEPVVVIPAGALLQTGDQAAVWVVSPDKVIQRRLVKVLRFDAETVTIQEGLRSGDLEVTDRIEKKLQEAPRLDYLKSYTKPGESVVYVNILESTKPADFDSIWYQVRKEVSDIRQTLPKGVQGPFFNDEFGDVFGVIYGLSFDGFSWREVPD